MSLNRSWQRMMVSRLWNPISLIKEVCYAFPSQYSSFYRDEFEGIHPHTPGHFHLVISEVDSTEHHTETSSRTPFPRLEV